MRRRGSEIKSVEMELGGRAALRDNGKRKRKRRGGFCQGGEHERRKEREKEKRKGKKKKERKGTEEGRKEECMGDMAS